MTRARRPVARTRAVGVVVPVRNEERLLASALGAIDLAFSRLDPWGLDCRTVIVLNGCTDGSAAIARRWAVELAERGGPHRSVVLQSVSAGVGIARAAGCAALLRRWRNLDPHGIWLSSTDADSRVPPTWLAAQIEAHERGVDLWTGRVEVDDWSPYHEETASLWSEVYDRERTPVHGASLGCNAHEYLSVGGFRSLETGEDRALYESMVARGARMHQDGEVKVITSARREARAPDGFSGALAAIDDDVGGRALIV
jgi:glycosyltransferase involved in cell wall biosynthesis